MILIRNYGGLPSDGLSRCNEVVRRGSPAHPRRGNTE
jgi:hypothetical protein